MVDEFQDTNALQLELLELLERDDLFVGRRRAAVDLRLPPRRRRHLPRAARRAVGARRGRRAGHATSAAGPRSSACSTTRSARCTAPRTCRSSPAASGDPAGGARVELLLTDAAAVETGRRRRSASLPSAPRLAPGRGPVLAARVAALVRGEGVAPAEIVVLLRAATDMAVFERALEEQGLSTLAAGGRGYWGRQQVLDLCAYLGALANPRDELRAVRAARLAAGRAERRRAGDRSRAPRRGASAWDALARRVLRGRADGACADDLPDADRDALANFCAWFAAERERRAAPRARRAARARRRPHRLRPARPRAAGRARGGWPTCSSSCASPRRSRRDAGATCAAFIDHATAELEAEAREPDAPGRGRDARRRAADDDPRRQGPRVRRRGRRRPRPRAAASAAATCSSTATALGLRLRRLDGGRATRARLRERCARSARRADAEEERRILYVAMTRAEERLLLSGAVEPDKLLAEPLTAVAPIRWLGPRLAAGLGALLEQATGDGTPLPADPDPTAPVPRVHVAVHRTPPPSAPGAPAPVAAEAPGPGHADPAPPPGGQLTLDLFAAPGGLERPAADGARARPAVVAAAPRALPAALSYSSLADYDRCAYRWYLQRVLRLPRDDAGPPTPPAAAAAAAAQPREGLDPLLRGTLVHLLLEDLDFAAPAAPSVEAVRAVAEQRDAELTDADVADLRGLVAAFADSPLAARLAAAPDVRREHGFVVGLGDEHAPLLNGFIDVLAFERSGSALVVDYKSDPSPPTPTSRPTSRPTTAPSGASTRWRRSGRRTRRRGRPPVPARPGEPAVAIYDQADVPRLRADLERLSAGIAAGRFVPTEHPHRTLCATCPGRRALCHPPEELTLRESPDPRSDRGLSRRASDPGRAPGAARWPAAQARPRRSAAG